MKALAILRAVERTVLVTIFLSMVGLYALNVGVRVFGGPMASRFVWIEEAVRIMNLFLVFLAIGLALEYGRHVGIHTWRERIIRATGLPIRRVIDAVGVFFALYMSWFSYSMASFVFSTGQRSPTLGMDMGWIYVAPAIGFLLLALRYALSVFGVIDRYSSQPGETE